MLDALVAAATRYTDAQPGESPFATGIDGLWILRSNREKPPAHLIFKPALCMVLQGAKWAVFGDKRYDYRAGQALVVSVELPALGRVAEASPAEPFLGVTVEFDLAAMRDVMEGLPARPEPSGDLGPGVFVGDVDGPVADCALRLVRLLETPEAIPMLAPLVMRELSYWLLTGPRGGDIAKIALASSHSRQLVRAIHLLRDRFMEPVRIDELAMTAGMSPSAFHRQFKAFTAMTPVQYQKQLRLLEARRLMATDAANAETAAFRVGYESSSQFSREYSRMFGAPPRRDIVGLRAQFGPTAAIPTMH
ncbi:MAG: Transcriptional regulator, AraC family [uncultured Thermomicrobiales bacterium]|uniref:Transcriptional regulator, AraC family n=1 Tax=uncultured Thermomicrobiales bacterium TaxID=1645740 RepID=A0A6J4VR26_9BACT|nr:MAG: Transcriptional regulator, AraC family [uncultured Thermomicrobiales bacterium]